MNFDIGFKLIFIEAYLGKTNYEYGLDVLRESSKCLFDYSDDLFDKQLNQYKQLIDKSIISGHLEGGSAAEYPFLKSTHFNALNMFFSQQQLMNEQEEIPFSFFIGKIKDEYISFAAYTLMKYSKSCSVCFFWPSTSKMIEKRANAEKIIKDKFNIIFEHNIELTHRALYNLCFLLYKGLERADECLNRYNRWFNEAVECRLAKESNCKIFFIVDDDQREMLKMKRTTLRDLFGIGFSSVHTSDGAEEALPIARTFLNRNSLELLFRANLCRNSKGIYKLLKKESKNGRAV